MSICCFVTRKMRKLEKIQNTWRLAEDDPTPPDRADSARLRDELTAILLLAVAVLGEGTGVSLMPSGALAAAYRQAQHESRNSEVVIVKQDVGESRPNRSDFSSRATLAAQGTLQQTEITAKSADGRPLRHVDKARLVVLDIPKPPLQHHTLSFPRFAARPTHGGIVPIRRRHTRHLHRNSTPIDAQERRARLVFCQRLLRRLCPRLHSRTAVLNCVSEHRRHLDIENCPVVEPLPRPQRRTHRPSHNVTPATHPSHMHRQRVNSTVEKRAEPWWLDPLPWWMPPPPEWGPLPPPMYVSFYHQPKAPPTTTANYAPLYDPAGFNPLSPYRTVPDIAMARPYAPS